MVKIVAENVEEPEFMGEYTEEYDGELQSRVLNANIKSTLGLHEDEFTDCRETPEAACEPPHPRTVCRDTVCSRTGRVLDTISQAENC